jgi:hypothetical protein
MFHDTEENWQKHQEMKCNQGILKRKPRSDILKSFIKGDEIQLDTKRVS